ncbi:MAG: plasmid partitioning protein RepB [Aestuariivita sp.]|nr:plasmid partitioning protein RepB [Aestuariivita sp.]
MARKSLKDMSKIAKTIVHSHNEPEDRIIKPSSPVLGALQGSLAAIKEIDVNLIDDWGPIDRLPEFINSHSKDDAQDFQSLKESIQLSGQQVPILVRKTKNQTRYEVIFGRRRLQACRELKIKVRANVQDLDDASALLAKGLENAARRNLSFYERARFADEILRFGHDTKTTMHVLNVSKSGLSHLTNITKYVPHEVGNQIGAAPNSGRSKWTTLAKYFRSDVVTKEFATQILHQCHNANSDERLETLLRSIDNIFHKEKLNSEPTIPVNGVSIQSNKQQVTVIAKKTGINAQFGEWLEANLPNIIQNAHQEFTAVNSTSDLQ